MLEWERDVAGLRRRGFPRAGGAALGENRNFHDHATVQRVEVCGESVPFGNGGAVSSDGGAAGGCAAAGGDLVSAGDPLRAVVVRGEQPGAERAGAGGDVHRGVKGAAFSLYFGGPWFSHTGDAETRSMAFPPPVSHGRGVGAGCAGGAAG